VLSFLLGQPRLDCLRIDERGAYSVQSPVPEASLHPLSDLQARPAADDQCIDNLRCRDNWEIGTSLIFIPRYIIENSPWRGCAFSPFRIMARGNPFCRTFHSGRGRHVAGFVHGVGPIMNSRYTAIEQVRKLAKSLRGQIRDTPAPFHVPPASLRQWCDGTRGIIVGAFTMSLWCRLYLQCEFDGSKNRPTMTDECKTFEDVEPLEDGPVVDSLLAGSYMQVILLFLQRSHIDPGLFCAHLASFNNVRLAVEYSQAVPTFNFSRRHSVHATLALSLLSMSMTCQTGRNKLCLISILPTNGAKTGSHYTVSLCPVTSTRRKPSGTMLQ
jgi:hypothetical protein